METVPGLGICPLRPGENTTIQSQSVASGNVSARHDMLVAWAVEATADMDSPTKDAGNFKFFSIETARSRQLASVGTSVHVTGCWSVLESLQAVFQ